MSSIKTKYSLFFLYFLFCSSAGQLVRAQTGTVSYQRSIKWLPSQTVTLPNDKQSRILYFENAVFAGGGRDLTPWWLERFPLNGAEDFNVSLENTQYSQPFDEAALDKEKIASEPALQKQVVYIIGEPYALVKIQALIKEGSRYRRLESFSLKITPLNDSKAQSRYKAAASNWKTNSALANGDWYKIAISASGIHVIDKSFLNNMGISTTGLNPKNIRLYGHGGSMLPQENAAKRDDDLEENAILVLGESDGRFDDGDKILFYAQGIVEWHYDSLKQRFQHRRNLYSNVGYYFLNIGSSAGKRISVESSLPQPADKIVDSYDEYYSHQEELKNFLRSGREWYGEEFNKVNTYNFDINWPNLQTNEPIYIRSEAAARSFVPSSMQVTANGTTVINEAYGSVIDDYTAVYVDTPFPRENTFTVNSSVIRLSYTYSKPSLNSFAWLNYFELNARRGLVQVSSQQAFRDKRSVGNFTTQFNISSAAANLQVWDISDQHNIRQMESTRSGNVYSFRTNTSKLREFVTFDGTEFLQPLNGVKIKNQDLHGNSQVDMVIVSAGILQAEAERLADFHKNKSGLKVLVCTPEQVFNEFSSGVQDVSAVRDMMRMFYERAANPQTAPKYLLMFGDASYDYRNIKGQNANLLLTYESRNSYDPIGSYCSDDYFGFLDPHEGTWAEDPPKEEMLDISIGRIPAKSATEAANVVNKIIAYHSGASMRSWRNDVVFIADDEDYNIHIDQANQLAVLLDSSAKGYNINKIYFDAYKQVSTPGGLSYPDVKKAISDQVNKGSLLVNYTGHGGETGWAHEKVVDLADINSWTNKNAWPLFITATCEFSKFDDPERTSGGELLLLNPLGGAIGLLTTVRLVYAFPNFVLNTNVYLDNMFKTRSAGRMPSIAEVFSQTKNESPSINSRNFTLLGDPALVLAYKMHDVITTFVNDKAVSSVPDTIKALSKVKIQGEIRNKSGVLLSNFNGTVYPTIYDKEEIYSTLGNDIQSSPYSFKLRKNVIYRGKASVVNGKFSFEFITPKDISYKNGLGRISYYAENGVEDATGFYENFVIGGTAGGVQADNKGPEIKLFMNDQQFVNGGNTDENPLFLAILSDENGINTVGSGIGREISAVIDGNASASIIMNDYYQSKLDSYKEGELRYNFKSLSEGTHSIKLKAWDVYNNSSEASLDFVVAGSASLALNNVLNYPNPFTSNTVFHFDHNKAGQPLQVQVQVFTIGGKLLKTLDTYQPAADSHFQGLSWDGRDDYGDKIGKGVYVYRVKVRAFGGDRAEKYEKLVILN